MDIHIHCIQKIRIVRLVSKKLPALEWKVISVVIYNTISYVHMCLWYYVLIWFQTIVGSESESNFSVCIDVLIRKVVHISTFCSF